MKLPSTRALTLLTFLLLAAPAAKSQSGPSNYRLAPGDQVDVRVLGEEQMSTITRVSNTGTIRVPFVDEDLSVQCKTEAEVSALVTEKLRRWLKKPEVHVAVKEFVGSPVAIIGAVGQPGRFQLQRPVTLLELLVFAGGPSDKAGKVVHIISATTTAPCELVAGATPEVTTEAPSETVSLAKLLDGDTTQNRLMHAGDIVVVPQADLVFIAGEVLKPNAYNLREGMTLTQVMALAGGPTNIAKLDAVRIVRQEPGKPRVEIPVSLKEVQSGKAVDPQLLANDVIEVPGSGGKKFLNGFLQAMGSTVAGLPVRVIP